MTLTETIEAARAEAERQRDEAAALAVALGDEATTLRRERARIIARLTEIEGPAYSPAASNPGAYPTAIRAQGAAQASIEALGGVVVRARADRAWRLYAVTSNGPKRATIAGVDGAGRYTIPGYGAPEIHPDDRHLIRCLETP